MYPESIEKLIECFKILPSVGNKTAERYALAMLEAPKEKIEQLIEALQLVSNEIKRCPICGNLTDKQLCSICCDENRDNTTICIVQQPKDVIAMEKVKSYKGLYHVLYGAISPLKGILPEDLNIESLFSRINENIKEVIIATNPTMEGDTTALYLIKALKKYPNITITKLANGLPIGANLDYADEMTLTRALDGRIKQ
ncbi:MAG: recombination mediator RecR [Erysipelotrichaceae bacterium]|nr:recombination mediator RecR [Erysipelotrichaceae bacterium]MDY3830196.1 recombination mediator RecR [Erysipelotrichaceae bacterium]